MGGRMTLRPGKRLGPYEILAPLGAGGMGEVYRARDTRLERDVAIKVLPAHLASNSQLKQRFEREARTVSSLNHPHICTLYDIGREDTTDYLVMECLEGETLAARLEKGPLPAEQVLRYGIEIADALDKAHRRGVVHRDLKPGNVMLTPQGGVKILDFGLAKSAPSVGAIHKSPLADSPTQSSPITAEGTIVGTFQYMAPEQLEGREADARSDIFSFGAVLYEMATGKKAFPGKSKFSVASAILEKDPEPIGSIQPMAPPALERVVERCLAKDPEDRWQTARDITVELKWILEAGSQAGVPAPVVSRRKIREKIAWGVAAVGVLLAASLAFAYMRHILTPVHPVRSSIILPEKVRLSAIFGGGPVLSPEGTRLALPLRDSDGKQKLFLRPLDSLTAQPLEGTEGGSYPFWSPDGRYIGFFAQGKLKKIDVFGGPPQTVCDAPNGRGGTWSQGGVIVFSPETLGSLSRVPAAGGAPTVITRLDQSRRETSHRWPTFLPGGRHFLYWGGDPFGSGGATLLATLTTSANGPSGIFLGTLDSNELKFLFPADSDALYAPPGYLLSLREQTLMAQPFDEGSLKLTGEAFPIAEQVSNPAAFRLGLFTASQNGILVFQTGPGDQSQLRWIDASGKEVGTVGDAGFHDWPRLSPDGQRLAESVLDRQSRNIDVWLVDLGRGVRTRFTFDPAVDFDPVWSPDGKRIVFASNRKGHYDLYVKNASGAGNEELLFESEADKLPSDWSRDGRYIAFSALDPKTKTNYDIWVLPLFGDRKPFPFLRTQFDELQAGFSPDGHWLAYASNESGVFEVYVAPFPGTGAKWQVSQGGGVQPTWSRDGKNLFYVVAGSKMMEVEVKAKGSTVEFGNPRQVLEANFYRGGPYGHAYEVAPSGQRFLVNAIPQAIGSTPLTLVVNWTAGLKK